MGDETAAECTAGRALCRGSECLPAAVTTGKFLSVIKDSPANCHQALFMPRAEGPCRFGQYATLQSMIFDRAGYKNISIFSPTSENGYAFLTPRMEMDVWKAICLGDALFKLRCRILPYHKHPIMAEALIKEVVNEICGLIRTGKDWKVALSSLTNTLSIDSGLDQPSKPLVGRLSVGPSMCPACNRPLMADMKFTVVEADGRKLDFCCVRCGQHYIKLHPAKIKQALATALDTGKQMSMYDATFVFGSDVAPCCAPPTVVAEQKVPFDACLGPLLAQPHRLLHPRRRRAVRA